jgi:multiple sugar transport system ATP-binding protein
MDLYNRPANLFVAGFIGSPAMNVVQALVRAGTGYEVGGTALRTQQMPAALARRDGATVALGFRPEHVRRAGGGDEGRLDGRVVLTEALGSALLVHVEVPGRAVSTVEAVDGTAHDGDVATVLAALPPEDRAAVGERIELALDPRRLHVFQLETGLALR